MNTATLRKEGQRRLQRIVALVITETGVTLAELDGRDRTERVASARQLAMALARETTRLSTVQLGQAFARDHATILHAVKATTARRDRDEHFAARYRHLLSQVTDH